MINAGEDFVEEERKGTEILIVLDFGDFDALIRQIENMHYLLSLLSLLMLLLSTHAVTAVEVQQ